MSQDEFFRHLNLQSVHHNQAKYHYRQALKERLRASSKSRLKAEKSSEVIKKSPQLSPCKWLTDSECQKLFGKPQIRLENSKSEPTLQPLVQNCHVLSHPGIKKEFEMRIKPNPSLSLILTRKSYLPEIKVNLRLPKFSHDIRKTHCICIRPQPGKKKIDKFVAQEKLRKLATLSMFGHYDGSNLVTLGPSSVSKSKVKPPPKPQQHQPNSTFKTTRESTPNNNIVKKSTSADSRLLKERQIHNLNLKVVQQDVFKKASGLNSCKLCEKKFKTPLRNWKEAISNSAKFCGNCGPLVMKIDDSGANPTNKCDICYKVFGKRSSMIRHITNNHPLNIHKVDLAKFANFKTPRSNVVQRQSWLESPTKHLKPLLSN